MSHWAVVEDLAQCILFSYNLATQGQQPVAIVEECSEVFVTGGCLNVELILKKEGGG